MSSPEIHLYLPQMRMSLDTIVERAQAAESAGFTGIALMDHLAPPMAGAHPMYDAVVTAGWIAARTTSLTVGHLVLCDALRHPAVLAKQAVSLDHASGGRFELGIGWGSVPAELERFGVTADPAPRRVERLAETLEVLGALWSGEPVDFEGAHHRVAGARQQPTPLTGIPVVVGGAGPRTLELVRRYATWWNCPMDAVDRFDELRAHAGDRRASVQQLVAFVPEQARRDEVTNLAERRFGGMSGGPVVGDAAELLERFHDLSERGVERIYVWFTDFAEPSTLAAFGEQVVAALPDPPSPGGSGRPEPS